MGQGPEDVRWCATCLNMSTRPRITFDEQGRCNACNWAEVKKSLDWESRRNELVSLLSRHRRNRGGFDCVVPVSGGKDGSYVAHQLKHKYEMHPLCVTVTPALSMEIGDRNLENFIDAGYDHLRVSPNPRVMRRLNKVGFVEMGFPYYGWLMAIQTVPVRIALQFGIDLIFYGEDGEVEYGGSSSTQSTPLYGVEYMREIYLEGGVDRVLEEGGVPSNDRYFFEFPDHHELHQNDLAITHWSYFENWDPYRNYLVARDSCGLEEAPSGNEGTFTNFAQNDQKLYALHAYLMYLKFGFGRATQDAGIEIRRGSMSREQALNLVRIFDGAYPEAFLDDYLGYFDMTKSEFDAVLDRWVNRSLFEKLDGRWQPTFEVR